MQLKVLNTVKYGYSELGKVKNNSDFKIHQF